MNSHLIIQQIAIRRKMSKDYVASQPQEYVTKTIHRNTTLKGF